MIHKIKYYFTTENYISEYKENIEEVKQEAREYKKNNPEKQNKILIFRNEKWIVVNHIGEIIYRSDIEAREFNAEEEINENV